MIFPQNHPAGIWLGVGKNCSSPLFSGVLSSLFPNSTFSIFTDSLYFCFSFLSPMLSHRYLHAFSTVSTIFSTILPTLFFPLHFFTFFKTAFPVQCNSFFCVFVRFVWFFHKSTASTTTTIFILLFLLFLSCNFYFYANPSFEILFHCSFHSARRRISPQKRQNTFPSKQSE